MKKSSFKILRLKCLSMSNIMEGKHTEGVATWNTLIIQKSNNMCVCVCVHVHVLYICVCIVRACPPAWMCAYLCVCVAYLCVCVCVCTRTYTCVYMSMITFIRLLHFVTTVQRLM